MKLFFIFSKRVQNIHGNPFSTGLIPHSWIVCNSRRNLNLFVLPLIFQIWLGGKQMNIENFFYSSSISWAWKLYTCLNDLMWVSLSETIYYTQLLRHEMISKSVNLMPDITLLRLYFSIVIQFNFFFSLKFHCNILFPQSFHATNFKLEKNRTIQKQRHRANYQSKQKELSKSFSASRCRRDFVFSSVCMLKREAN